LFNVRNQLGQIFPIIRGKNNVYGAKNIILKIVNVVVFIEKPNLKKDVTERDSTKKVAKLKKIGIKVIKILFSLH
jgi:hypothetical protein